MHLLSLLRMQASARLFSSKTSYGLTEAIGNTPLIYLKGLSEKTGCRILGKAEFQNPGGSVKDRAALGVINDAERRSLIRPGGTIVEGTAGNTGIGLAHVCRAKGYKVKKKIDLLRMLGAEVHPVPAVAYENPENYNHKARDYAKALNNAIWTDQFDNTANADAHYETTGPEIWEQAEGKVDGFICATGTGGTLAGVGNFLKEKSDGKAQVWLADPPGSVLHSFINEGRLNDRSGSSITEGIGQGRITKNLGTFIKSVDGSLRIPDEASILMVYEMLDTEGLYIGASSALNVVAAKELAFKLGPGKTIVTILCDGAYRYQSRLFSKKWLKSKGLENAIPEGLEKYARSMPCGFSVVFTSWLCSMWPYKRLVNSRLCALEMSLSFLRQLHPLKFHPVTKEIYLRLPEPRQSIIITPSRASDAPVITKLLNDPQVYKTLTGPPYPYRREDAEVWLASVKTESDSSFETLRDAAENETDMKLKYRVQWLLMAACISQMRSV
ncbi:hypothetical protein EW145_g1282 [Phellinidium pouzarii]|uniref:Cysteine synthase 1 n=1 Tax=Phellinidium pouzarii TaxID=167371 RepID=A0A4S4LFB6_9AGAM|nr:hypothetical protein EW145_g1282 [Phellinidium pouzarii]